MAECTVYQIILFRVSVCLFAEYERDGGGSLLAFTGTGEEPRCAAEEVSASPFRHPRYAGSKLLGTMRRDRVDEAWALCRAHIDDDEDKKKNKGKQQHSEVTDWCVAAAALLARRGLVRPKKWWTLPPITEGGGA